MGGVVALVCLLGLTSLTGEGGGQGAGGLRPPPVPLPRISWPRQIPAIIISSSVGTDRALLGVVK